MCFSFIYYVKVRMRPEGRQQYYHQFIGCGTMSTDDTNTWDVAHKFCANINHNERKCNRATTMMMWVENSGIVSGDELVIKSILYFMRHGNAFLISFHRWQVIRMHRRPPTEHGTIASLNRSSTLFAWLCGVPQMPNDKSLNWNIRLWTECDDKRHHFSFIFRQTVNAALCTYSQSIRCL